MLRRGAVRVGLIGAGLIAVPVLAGSAAYPLAELFTWKEGLNKTLRGASAFYAVIAAAVLIGIGGNFLGIDPVAGLVYAAVLQGCLAPFLIVIITLRARDSGVMGNHPNGWFDTSFGFLAAAVMAAAAVTLGAVSFLG
jgi:Mn2+/Fe2+ NRAMP family transporter